MSKIYDEKVELAKNFVSCEPTSRIPFYPNIQTWGIGYGGGKSTECIGNPELELKYFSKCLRDIHNDGVQVFGLNRPEATMVTNLGFAKMSIADDDVTVLISDDSAIMDDEVEAFAKDPIGFLRDVALPRRYPALRAPYPENVNAAASALKGLLQFQKRSKYLEKRLRKEFDIPFIGGGFMLMPFDSYITTRSFAKGMIDLRRKPEAVLEALEKLYDFYKPAQKMKGFPFQTSPMTSGTYLNPKMFDKFYWPTAKRMIMANIDMGAQVLLFLEGMWGREQIEHFLELPEGRVILSLDENDPVEVKSYMKEHVAIIAGFPSEPLKTGTVAEVRDEATRLIEALGNRGVAMQNGKCLLSPSDAKPENIIALSETCRDYKF